MKPTALTLWIVLPFAAPAIAQCTLQVQPGAGVPGTDTAAYASALWDPDGGGPMPPRLVVAGDFQTVGTVAANRIAVQDPTTGAWSPLGAGLNRRVLALAALPNGELVAAGEFTAAAGAPTSDWIARWNGTTWSSLGAGLYAGSFTSPKVTALAVLPNGDLVVGGEFLVAGVSAVNVARWDGTNWFAMGPAVPGSFASVRSLAAMPNGDVFVGGFFTSAAGTPAVDLARWDGSVWSPVAGGLVGVSALLTLPSGELVVAAGFTTSATTYVRRVARWNGATMTPLGAGAVDGVRALSLRPNGDIVAAGSLTTADGVPADGAARWDGSVWSGLGAATPQFAGHEVASLTALPNGDLIAVGGFDQLGGVVAANLARWNGSNWFAFGSGTLGSIAAFATLANGELVAGGSFTLLEGVPVARIARRSGSSWVSLGTGVDGQVSALAVLPNGDLVAGGSFTNAGGIAAACIARWNGAVWAPLGGGVSGSQFGAYTTVTSLLVLPNGDLIAGGHFLIAGGVPVNHIARWNGIAWSALGGGVSDAGFLSPRPFVHALAALPNGDLVAGGTFSFAGGANASRIARWNGTAWSGLGAGWPGGSTQFQARVTALLVATNGDLVAGGTAAGILSGGPLVVRWNGSTWAAFGGGLFGAGSPFGDWRVDAMAWLPDGDLVVGGYAVTTTPAGANNTLARWDGAGWTAVATVASGTSDAQALAVTQDGELAVGGSFPAVGGVASTGFARLRSSCPATALVTGAGCVGSAGPQALAATALPWLGGTFRARATGMPAQSIALAVTSLSPTTIPLALVLPIAGAGCDGLLTPILSDVVLPNGGSADTGFALPDAPSFVGLNLYHYVASLEFDAGGALVGLTSTNRLTLALGVF